MSDQPLSKLLIPEPPLQVLPSLAVRLGLDASIFAQQLHYMLINPKLGKVIDGRKWIFCTLEEWHETYPFWCINTIRKIIEDLVKVGIVLEGNFNETLNRRKWYTLDYDQLNTAVIKQPKSPRPESANFGDTMKLRKKAKQAKPLEYPNSGHTVIQTLDNDSYSSETSSETSLNSFEAKASHELAPDTPSEEEKLRANLPHLNKDERDAMKHLLNAVQNGKVVESTYSAKVVTYLIELGEVERCQFGLYPGLQLKAKPTPQPLTGCKNLPEHIIHADEKPADLAIDELHNVLQSTFIDGVVPSSHGNGKSPAAPAPLPDVPEGWPVAPDGLVLRYEEKMFTPYILHYGNDPDKINTLCGIRSYQRSAAEPHHVYTGRDWRPAKPSDYRVCEKCAAKAAAKPPRAAKAKRAAKPAIYSSTPLFDAIAAFSFNATDKADVNAVAGRVGKIRAALADYVVAKLGHEPTPEEVEKVVNRAKGFGAWYDDACKGCDRPQSADSFMAWWIKYVAAANGSTIQPLHDTSCPHCQGARFVLVRNDKGIDNAVPCECQKETTQ
jgi:hypothetical protein